MTPISPQAASAANVATPSHKPAATGASAPQPRRSPNRSEGGAKAAPDSRTKTLRPVRALLRGLEALQVLNRKDGATVTEVAAATRLPRTTAHRVLETLCIGGYAVRDAADERYRPTLTVKSLSDGYGDERWIREAAKPLLDELTKGILWPVGLAVPHGTAMVLRATTDKDSPLALERHSAGLRLPLLDSAAGLTWLAFSDPERRQAMLDVLFEDAGDAADRPQLERRLEQARSAGWIAQADGSRQITIAVPVMASEQAGHPIACLTMRWIASALNEGQVLQRYLGRLQETAKRIAEAHGPLQDH